MTVVDVETLPLVLCGPMLRRVEARSVSVFVALKAPAQVQVVVHDGPAPSPGVSVPAHRSSSPVSTVAVGRHLHVVVATLEIPEPAPALTSGQIYGYDVLLQGVPGTAGAIGLAETGLLGGSHPLGFEAGRLPSFALMPPEIDAVKLLHGSCRKPHGEGDDMLAEVDELINRPEVRTSASARPHLLLLTGDQIYADDVAPALLRALHDAGNALLGWAEVVPGTGTDLEPLLQLLAIVRAEADPLTDITVAAAQAGLDALRERLLAAIADARLAEDPAVDRRLRLALQAQLRRFAADAERVASETGQALADGVHDLAAGIVAWLEAHAEIFGELSSNAGWGRIAGFEGRTDAELADSLQAALQAVAEATGVAADTLLDELDAAAAATPDGRVLADLVEDLRSGAAALRAAAPTPDQVVDLARGVLDSLTAEATEPYVASRISPPQRAKELRRHARLTSDVMDAHLLFLGEFYAMYLFAFSPAAWPRDADGDLRLPRPQVAVPNYGLTGALGRRGIADTTERVAAFAADVPRVRRVLANVPTLMLFDDHEVSDDWNLHADWVATVNGSIVGPSLLRNALAAYAVFQDWGNRPGDYLPGGTGRRLLDQLVPPAAGVDPLGPPPPIATAPAATDALLGIGPAVATALPPQTLAEVVDAVTVLRDETGRYAFVAEGGPGERKRWDWDYRPSPDAAVHVVGLDTRTHRGYPTAQWGVRASVPLFGDPQVGGRVAAPLLVHPDELQRQFVDRLTQTDVHIVVSPAPVFGLPLVEDLFQRLQALTSGPEVADMEAWQANPEGFGHLLRMLREADVVLLSGDVHYGYTNVVHFPEPNPNLARNLCVQLTSSSLRNEAGLTRLLGSIGREGRLLELLVPDEISIERLWGAVEELVASAEEIGDDIADAGRDLTDLPTWFAETAPMLAVWDPESWISYWLALKDKALVDLVLPTVQGLVGVGGGLVAYVLDEFLSVPGVLGSRDGEFDREDHAIRFLADDRGVQARRDRAAELNQRPADTIPFDVEDADRKLGRAAEVVGFNNVGRIDFASGAGTSDDVRHELVWKVHDARGEPEPLVASTIHGAAPDLPSFGQRLAAAALRERAVWHPPEGEIHEYDPAGHDLLRSYLAELEPLNDHLPVARRFYDPVAPSGARMLAWSAHFVCFCLLRAGADTLFPFSSRHIDYVRAAKQNRLDAGPSPFHLLAKDEPEAVVQVGDIVVSVDPDGNPRQYDEIDPQASDMISSHCDIVVAVEGDVARCVGGNVEGDVPPRPGHGNPSGWTCNHRRQTRTLQDGQLTNGFVLGVIRRRDVAP